MCTQASKKDPQLGRRSREEEAAAIRGSCRRACTNDCWCAHPVKHDVCKESKGQTAAPRRPPQRNGGGRAGSTPTVLSGLWHTTATSSPPHPAKASLALAKAGHQRQSPSGLYTPTCRSGQPLCSELAQMTRPADMIKTLDVAQAGCQQQAVRAQRFPAPVSRFRSHRRELLC